MIKNHLKNIMTDMRIWTWLMLSSCSFSLWAMQVEAYRDQGYVIYPVQHLDELQLHGYQQQQPIYHFSAWQKSLKPCQSLHFAMNAGMYHPDFQPVGLFIKNYQYYRPLNQQSGQGNFFFPENGVLAWNDKEAVILPTSQYAKSQFLAKYATQSGPMLLINQNINPNFDANATSKKIRNGVGLIGGQLVLVMSEKKVSFYEFAAFFKNHLQADYALYLDGSISSIYAPNLKRYDRAYRLGPMLGVIKKQQCIR